MSRASDAVAEARALIAELREQAHIVASDAPVASMYLHAAAVVQDVLNAWREADQNAHAVEGYPPESFVWDGDEHEATS